MTDRPTENREKKKYSDRKKHRQTDRPRVRERQKHKERERDKKRVTKTETNRQTRGMFRWGAGARARPLLLKKKMHTADAS